MNCRLNKFYKLFLFTLVGIVFSISSIRAELHLTRDQILSDANQLENLLNKYHPNVYTHRTPDEIRKLWEKYKSAVPANPKFLDAATLYQQMLAAVCDEHTAIVLNGSEASAKGGIEKSFRASLAVVKNKLFFDNDDFGDNSTEILSINEKEAAEIIEFIRSINYVDGCTKSDILFSNHISNSVFSSLLISNFVGHGNVKLVLKKSDSKETYDASLPPEFTRLLSNWSNYASGERSGHLERVGISLFEDSWESLDYQWSELDRSPTQFAVGSNSDNSLHYIYVPSFSGGKSQADSMDKTMRQLVKSNAEHVIIDLSDNPGGLNENAQRLLSYFLNTSSRIASHMRSKVTKLSDPNFVWFSNDDKRQLLNHLKDFKTGKRVSGQYRHRVSSRSFGNKSFKGNVTVLVSPRTRSAATIVATILKEKIGATIVGNIGDASMVSTCGGVHGNFLLQHSQVRVAIPTTCYTRSSGAKTKGNLLNPDIPVNLSAQQAKLISSNTLKAAIESKELAKFVLEK